RDRPAPLPPRPGGALGPRPRGDPPRRGAAGLPGTFLLPPGVGRAPSPASGEDHRRGRGGGPPDRRLPEPPRRLAGHAPFPSPRGPHPLLGRGGRGPLPHRPHAHPAPRLGRAGRGRGNRAGRVGGLRRPHGTGRRHRGGDPGHDEEAAPRRPPLRSRRPQLRPRARRPCVHPGRPALPPRGAVVIEAVSSLVDRAVEEGVFEAAQVALRASRATHDSAHGGLGPARTDRETLFDVSSLTKVVATTTLVHRLVSDSALSFEDEVGRFFPEASCREATIRDLLSHRSGLPAWRPLFATARSREEVVSAALRAPLEGAPGSERRYS